MYTEGISSGHNTHGDIDYGDRDNSKETMKQNQMIIRLDSKNKIDGLKEHASKIKQEN